MYIESEKGPKHSVLMCIRFQDVIENVRTL